MRSATLFQFRILSFTVLFLSGVWIWFTRITDPSQVQHSIPAPRQGFAAPEFTLSSTDGESLSLSSLRGNVVILNFWASWCRPCKEEMPALQKVHEIYQGQELVILGINATDQDNHPAAIQFIEQNRLSFPMLFDVDGSVSRLYHLTALPTTYFVDRQGIIQDVIVGGPMAEALLRIRAEGLLEENR